MSNAVADFRAREACQYKPDAQASEYFQAARHTRLRVGLVFYMTKVRYGVALWG